MWKQNMATMFYIYTVFQEDCLVDVITVFRHLEKGSFLGRLLRMKVAGPNAMW